MQERARGELFLVQGPKPMSGTLTCQQGHVGSRYHCDVGHSKNLNVVHLCENESTVSLVDTV